MGCCHRLANPQGVASRLGLHPRPNSLLPNGAAPLRAGPICAMLHGRRGLPPLWPASRPFPRLPAGASVHGPGWSLPAPQLLLQPEGDPGLASGVEITNDDDIIVRRAKDERNKLPLFGIGGLKAGSVIGKSLADGLFIGIGVKAGQARCTGLEADKGHAVIAVEPDGAGLFQGIRPVRVFVVKDKGRGVQCAIALRGQRVNIMPMRSDTDRANQGKKVIVCHRTALSSLNSCVAANLGQTLTGLWEA